MRFLAVIGAMLAAWTPLALNAQALPPPPTQLSLDENGVDLTDGSFNFSKRDIHIGPESDHGLSFVRSYGRRGWSNNLDIDLYQYTSGGQNYMFVRQGNLADKFLISGGTYTSVLQNGATLVNSAGALIYTAANGTIVSLSQSQPEPGNFLTQVNYILFPDGVKQTFYYKSFPVIVPPCNTQPCPRLTFQRLSSVTNNLGYQLKFTYASNTPNFSTIADWLRISKVTGINNGVDYCDPTADSCSGFTVTWPAVTFTPTVSGSDTITAVADPLGNTWKFTEPTSSSTPQLKAIRRPGAATDTTTITLTGGKVSAIVNEGRTWGYSFSDVSGTRTATVTDPLSHQQVVISTIATGLVATDQDALGNTTSFQYDAAGRVTRVTAPEGNYVQYTYDGRGNVTQSLFVPKSGSGLSNITTSASFDATCTNVVKCNKPNSTTDERGKVTDYTYDATHGGIATITRPAATTGATRPKVTYTYTSLAAWYKNSGGTIVQASPSVYELTGISTCQTTASCAGAADEVKTAIAYQAGSGSAASNLLPVTSAKGSGNGALTATTALTFDNIGNMLTVDGPLSGSADTTRFRYDADRQVIGVVGPDPDGAGALKYRAVRYTYNADGQQTLIERGTVTSQSDAAWAAFASLQQQAITYDSAAQKAKETLAASGTTYAATQYSYDGEGRLSCAAVRMNASIFASLPGSACTLGTQGVDGPDRITKYTYDNVDQVTKVQTAYGTAVQRDDTTSTYSNNGKLATVADGANNKTTYEYDGFDRLLKTRYPSPSTPGTSSSTDYEQLTYDAASNVTQRRLRDTQSISYSYDDLNRLTHKGGATTADRDYSYDLLDRMLSATFTSGGQTVTATYDALSRPLSQTAPQGTVSYQYDLAGRRTRTTWPDSFYVTYDYLLTNDMTAIRENGAASGIGVLATIAYDDLGQRTSLTRGNGTTVTYGFDPVSRLTSLAQDLSGTSADQTQTFSYAASQQITAQTRSNDAYAWTQQFNTNRNYSDNGLNQYTAVGSFTPTYDARGNLTALGTAAYAYNGENLMTSASGSMSATLAYDPLNRLYETAAAGVTTRFLYDGGDLVGEYNGSNSLQRRYVHGPGEDEPLVWYEGSGTSDRRWLSADERGSVTAITNASGAAIGINAYSEYGIPQTTNLGRFQYTGQAWLSEVGLYYYKARIYSATLGRFLQTDPIGYEGGMNLYAYVGNEPINRTDPWGLRYPEAYREAVDPNGIDVIASALKGLLKIGVSASEVYRRRLGGVDLSLHVIPGTKKGPAPRKDAEACSAPMFQQALNDPAYRAGLKEAVKMARSTPSRAPRSAASETGFTWGPRILGSGYSATSAFTTRENGQVSYSGWQVRSRSYLRNIHPFIYTHIHTPGAANYLSGEPGDIGFSNENDIPIVAYDYEDDLFLCHQDQ